MLRTITMTAAAALLASGAAIADAGQFGPQGPYGESAGDRVVDFNMKSGPAGFYDAMEARGPYGKTAGDRVVDFNMKSAVADFYGSGEEIDDFTTAAPEKAD